MEISLRTISTIIRTKRQLKGMGILLLLACTAGAQNIPSMAARNRVSLFTNDTLFLFYAEQPPARKFTVAPEKFYFWYNQHTILMTQGAFSNRVLHKSYYAFYPNQNVYQEGSFYYGLKDGLWRGWYPTGRLQYMIHYNKGLLHGSYATYDEQGNKLKEDLYKDGLLVPPTIPDTTRKIKPDRSIKSDSTSRAPRSK